MFLFAGLSACRDLNVPDYAHAEIINSEGAAVGTATLFETGEGVNISLKVMNLPPGNHGFHIHENGECIPPDFKSAGGHFALPAERHGFESVGEPHLGDMLNLQIADDGSAEIQRLLSGATLGDGMYSLLDKAIVIHAEPDDNQSQPSGNTGSRIACGVIRPSSQPLKLLQNP
jgi:Cu-Zn family superoxide dismutase